MMKVLKDCPFCGSESVIVEKTYPRYYGTCIDCGSTGPTKSSREAATAAWNRRAVPDDSDDVKGGESA